MLGVVEQVGRVIQVWVGRGDQHLPVFTEEHRARLQKSRAERIALPKTKESLASVAHIG